MKKILLLSLVLQLCVSMLYAQNLLINEVVTQNHTISDLSGNKPDWIEIYNPSNQVVDLKGYSLSDEVGNPKKWTFKNSTILPDSFIVVFASDVSHDSLTGGLRQSIEDITNIGWAYGDKTDATPGTSEVTYTLFQNTIFGLINGKKAVAGKIYLGPAGALGYSYAGVHVKFKDWEAEVNRSAYDLLRVRMYLEKGKKANLQFSQTGLEDWQNYSPQVVGTGDTSWYEIPLKGNLGRLDLSKLKGLSLIAPGDAYGQSFDFVILNIQFSVQAVERFHANFKLSSSGENVFLSSPQGTVIDIAKVPSLLPDISFGRKTDGNEEWVIFEKPSPNKSNGGNTINGICNKVLIFDKKPGFYTGSQSISVVGANTIRYTLDGSKPTTNSPLYTGAITTDTTVVINAGCFENDFVPKTIYSNTYLIDYQTKLPVWSISTNPSNFFDLDSGIYVFGREGSYTNVSPYFDANFWEDWERPIHVEFFEENKQLAFELDCGVKIFGNYSRANNKKSLSLHFRDQYGTSKLEYPIFPDYPGIEVYDDLLLRNSGGDADFLHFRDGFHHVLAKDLDFEKMKYRPAVLFINGKYWGIHNIREKSNEDYFKENYNIDKKDIDIITAYFGEQEGPTCDKFIDFHTRLKNGAVNYAEITKTIDIQSFIDYHLFEIYIANFDWPANNVKYWRQSSVNGKWRWFLYDTDFSTGIYGHVGAGYTYNHFKQATTFQPDVPWPNNENSTLLLRECLKNQAFKQQLVNRYCDLINTLFVPDTVFKKLQSAVLDKMQEEVAPNRIRWNLDVASWNDQLVDYKDFWQKRAPYARTHIKDQIELDNEVALTLNIQPAGAGYIKLNTIEIDDPNWSGIYFKGIPVNLEAVANPGFVFSDWNSSALPLANTSSPKISNFDLLSPNTFTANFTGSKVAQFVTISEINYHSSPTLNTNDWIELHNYGTQPVDLSNWYLKDLKIYNKYVFPEGTILNPDARLVVVESKDTFMLVYPDMKPFGSMNFGLNNSGETIYLYDDRNKLVQRITFDDVAPWATYPDGRGGTLDLEASTSDVNNPASWKSICLGGSPMEKFDATCPIKPVGILDQTIESQVKLYPNPAEDWVKIEMGNQKIVQVKVSDLRGVELLQSESDKLYVGNLSKGMYLIKIVSEIAQVNSMLIKR